MQAGKPQETNAESTKNDNQKPKKIGFIRAIFKEGRVVLIYGQMGTGKTNFSCFLMEKAISNYGYHIHTNIGFFKENNIEKAKKEKKLPENVIKKPCNLHCFNKLSDLILELCKHEKNIVFIDEAGILASSSRSTSKTVRTMKELTYLIRHFNASIAFICQSPNSIVPDLRENLVDYRIKTFASIDYPYCIDIQEKRILEDEYGDDKTFFKSIDKIGNIEKTRLPLDSKFIPQLSIDIPIEKLLCEISQYDSIDLKEKAPKVIEKLKFEDNKKSNKRYVRTSIYAEIKKISLTTVYRYIKNKKITDIIRTPGGQYRIALDD
jgi:hypothetical protein